MKDLRWFQVNPAIFALLSALILPFLCISMYSMALFNGHVAPVFPYVSDAASQEPQSYLFLYLTVLIGATISLTGLARYQQVKYYSEGFKGQSKQQIERLNTVALYCMVVSSLGAVICGLFTATDWLVTHCVGVVMMCAMAITEVCMIVISIHLSRRRAPTETFPLSLMAIFTVQFIAGALCFLFAMASWYYSSYGQVTSGTFRLHWAPHQPGYWCHAASAAFEWIAINCNSLFMLCLYRRMRTFQYWTCAWNDWLCEGDHKIK